MFAGLLGLFLAAGTYTSVFSHGALHKLDKIENEVILPTMANLFTITSVFDIIQGIAGLFMISIGISGFAAQYNADAAQGKSSNELQFDLFVGVSFIIGIFATLYKLFFAMINFFYYPITDGWVPITYRESEYFAERGEVFGIIWYWFQRILGPNKLNIILSVPYIVGFGYLNYWTQMMYYLVPLIPKIIMEFGVFTVYPQLDLPDLPFQAVVDAWTTIGIVFLALAANGAGSNNGAANNNK